MIANLHIQTILRGRVTCLGKAFFTPPFKVANITEDKKAATLQLMLMSSSPGILDEDRYHLKIELAANTSLQLHTQSYQRLFDMKLGAEQHTELHLQPGASFCFLPHPSVPHANARFMATNNIYLSHGCRLLWGEIITCGRKLNGEIFHFSKYHSLTSIFIENRLAIRENMLIVPDAVDITGMGLWEGFTHQASLIYMDENTTVEESTQLINTYLSRQPGIAYGITAAPVRGLVVRLLGYKAEQLFDCLKTMAAILSPVSSSPFAYAH